VRPLSLVRARDSGVHPVETLEGTVEHQSQLFRPLPSHVYVSCHWSPVGWEVVLTSSTPLLSGVETQRLAYDHLTSGELVDVVSAQLERLVNAPSTP
jgi:hypothetical protein